MKSRLLRHAAICIGAWLILTFLNNSVEPLTSYYLALVAMYATAMFGMVILVGLSGQVSLGNGAIMAVGAYVFALSLQHWNAVISMVLAGLAGVIVGLVLGVVGARLRGPYLAGLTLAFAVGIPAIANRFPSVLGGEDGLKVPAPGTQLAQVSPLPTYDESSIDQFLTDQTSGVASASPTPTPKVSDLPAADVSSFVLEHWQASVAIAVAGIVGFVALNLVRGRQGKGWQAVRDDPVAASVVGISPATTKVTAFIASSLFAALAGAVFAQILCFVSPGAFGLRLSLILLVGVVLGGRLSLVGALIGAVIVVWLPELVSSLGSGWSDQVANNVPNLVYGLLVVAVVVVAPSGFTGLVSRFRSTTKS